MIKLNSYSDEDVFEAAKEFIKDNLKAGDQFSTSMLQRTFSIGYFKAVRILEMLDESGTIKLSEDRIKSPIIL